MPIYEYQANEGGPHCGYCVNGFEIIQQISDAPLKQCPKCGAPVTKQISAPRVGSSKSNLDDRAKSAGFTKLKRLGKGEYERQY